MRNFYYENKAISYLKKLDPLKAFVLIDYFENNYSKADNLNDIARVFKTSDAHFIYMCDDDDITVLTIT